MLQLVTSSFLMVFLAEMADKTQFLVVSLSAKCRTKQLVCGVALSAVLLNLLAVFLGSAIASLIPVEVVKLIAGAAFLGFSLWTFAGAEKGHESNESISKMCSTFGITTAFFLAEFGDKTQLGAISLAAANPDAVWAIFIGCTAGLLAADGAGIIIGLLLGKTLPEKLLKYLSGFVFALFGFTTLYTPLKEFGGLCVIWTLPAIGAVTIILAYVLIRKRKYIR